MRLSLTRNRLLAAAAAGIAFASAGAFVEEEHETKEVW